MKNNPTDGPGATARAEQTIKFADLTSAQQEQVRKQANAAIVNGPAANKHAEAAGALSDALDAELHKLNEPITTGALFLVAGVFCEFASEVLYRIGRVQAGVDERLEGINDPYLRGIPRCRSH